MSNVYEYCPSFESGRFLLRFTEKEDAPQLLKVYSDLNALPFFNSDNCDGDNFFYPTIDKMEKAIDFWLDSYRRKWFVRWSIIDKKAGEIIGTVELFNRRSSDAYDGMGVLRLDLRSDYEKTEEISDIISVIVPPAYDLFDCQAIITKIPVYAVQRMEAMKRFGFEKSEELLIGTHDHYGYNNYWVRNK